MSYNPNFKAYDARNGRMEKIKDMYWLEENCINKTGPGIIEGGYIQKYIILTGTGLEDVNGDEIFEGHLIKLWESILVIKWETGCFRAFDKSPDLNNCLDQSEIIGHVLTDPDLVPDYFNVGSYFGMEDKL